MADVTEFTKNSNPMEIVINDGSERVPIKNLSGEEIGVFYFRPTDIGIIDRYNKIAKEFGGITEPLDRAEIGPDGTVEDLSDEDDPTSLIFCFVFNNIFGEETMSEMIAFEI